MFAPQPVEHRQPAMPQHVANGIRDAVADARQLLQTGQPFSGENLRHRLRQFTQRLGCALIRQHPKATRALLGKDARHFVQPAGDIFVDGARHGNSTACEPGSQNQSLGSKPPSVHALSQIASQKFFAAHFLSAEDARLENFARG
jgi:hypothetical protein